MNEAISVLDMLKIGVGPSSSHTLGPWRAALSFLDTIKLSGFLSKTIRIKVQLYGSLAKTGKGHCTDIAILMGLEGQDPITCDLRNIQNKIDIVNSAKCISLDNKQLVSFDFASDFIFNKNESLPFHPNGLTFQALDNENNSFSETYFSIGGGFITKDTDTKAGLKEIKLPYPAQSALELLNHCTANEKSISEIVTQNERAWRTDLETENQLLQIWEIMQQGVFEGCKTSGELPGGLFVKRRAKLIFENLAKNKQFETYEDWQKYMSENRFTFNEILSWVSCFALAINEQNAAMGRVVTAPTNGSAGVIPAVLQYFIFFENGNSPQKIIQFLKVAGEIGSYFKKKATISAAMGGCQAEIGVSSAMAAAALTECLGGSPKQAMMAAEIAMEHHLGLTCDPIGGLVQIPCIERNSMGAIKAIMASNLALQSNPNDAKVSLDQVIETMWETAKDMNSKYKETSDGGLAIRIPISLSEC
ncbi:MAG: L-serine ammonia-lyase [Bacteroidota bacterium]